MSRPKKKEPLPKGVEVIPGGELALLLKVYGPVRPGDGKCHTGEDLTIGKLVRELAWRRGALTAPQKS